MKRTLAILIALMMVLSTSIFAAPAMVSMETVSQVPEIIPEKTESDAALSAAEEAIHDEYGYLLYNLDFETDAGFTGGQKVSAQGFVNEDFNTEDEWTIGGPGTTEKKEENGNHFIRFRNSTSSYSQFHVYSNGCFTDANGYYTIVADVRYTSGGAGADLKDFSVRSYVGDKVNYTLGNTMPTGNFTTGVVQYKNVGTSTPLSRTSFVFEYKTAPTEVAVDIMDIDNIKLYYKPLSVEVTVLGNSSEQNCVLEIAIPDTMNSVVTKSKLLELVNENSNANCIDLTLEDGSAFEQIDVLKVDTVKAIYKTYETTHSEYGTLLYELDFETDADFAGGQKVSAQGFVNETFSTSGDWTIGGPPTTEKKEENGNHFIRFRNSTSSVYSQFQVSSNGQFTDVNGYYTIVADVRYTSGESGAELKDFSFRSTVGDETNYTLGNTMPTGEFTTGVVQYKNVGTSTPLSRTLFVFEYKTLPTEVAVDEMDIDNIKLYYKPLKTSVTILGDGIVADTNVEITPADDSYVVTKSELMSLVKAPANAILADLTLADGTAFETVDLDVVKEVKAVYRTYEIYDDTYGHLIYNLDFETDADYSKNNKASAHGFVNEAFCPTSGDWHIGGPGGRTTKVTENGNSFIRMKNGTSQYTVFQVYSNGKFTEANGYYTIVADVRAALSGNSGAELNSFWPQSLYMKADDSLVNEGGRSSFTNFGSDFKTAAIQLSPRSDDGIKLYTMKYTFEHKKAPSVASEDNLDLDNIRLYFKPFSKNVTVLAGDNTEFENQAVNVTINLDLNSIITKEKLMALVENNTDMILSDLTLADGTAFEEIDVMKVNEVKAVWKSRAPQSYDGASIRVTGPSGIRFRASVTNEQKALAVEYGFVVTLEKHLKGADMTTLTLESENKVVGVSYGYDSSIQKEVDRIYETDDIGNIFFTAVVYGTPATKNAYNEPIIVRPYLKDDDGVYHYSMPIKRSIIEVARAIRDTGYANLDEAGIDYVKGILTVCEETV